MKPIEVVKLIRKSKPKLLGQMPDERAAKIIFAALVEIRKEVESTNEGMLRVGGLGRFNVRNPKPKEGQDEQPKKRIFFRPAKPKQKVSNPPSGSSS